MPSYSATIHTIRLPSPDRNAVILIASLLCGAIVLIPLGSSTAALRPPLRFRRLLHPYFPAPYTASVLGRMRIQRWIEPV